MVMRQMNDVVIQYLKMDTNFALMISGEWGSGKTHYFKNTLSQIIEKIPVYYNNQRKYKPILVSLFGLKSLEEVQTEILLNLFPLLKKKGVRIAANLGKAVVKGLLQWRGWNEFGEIIADTDVDQNTLIKFDEIVLCFDDFERINDKLSISELIGYINSLVEGKNIKILIIANEGKVQDKQYSALKEKVIGNTIEFHISSQETFSSIIEERFSESPGYLAFLKESMEFVLDCFSMGSSNMRTLIFILTYFHEVFSEIKNNLSSIQGLKAKEAYILRSLLHFTISISIEYKEGRVTPKRCRGLESPPSNVYNSNGIIKEQEINDNNYTSYFLQKYDYIVGFFFYKSLYTYITGGDIFRFPNLLSELKRSYNIEDGVIPPHYIAFDALKSPGCHSLHNDEYKELTQIMLSAAYAGSYKISDYLSIFHFATRFDNMLDLNIDTLVTELIKGLHKIKGDSLSDKSIESKLSISNNEYQNYQLRLKEQIIEINRKACEEKELNGLKYVETLFYRDFDSFPELTSEYDYYFKPVFSVFSPDKFFHFFNEAVPATRWEIANYFKERYNQGGNLKYLHLDIPFLEKVKEKLEEAIKCMTKDSIERLAYTELNKAIEYGIEQMGITSQSPKPWNQSEF